MPESTELAITLSAPVPEPAPEPTEPEEINVTPAPPPPVFAQPMAEPVGIPEEVLPPMDPRHEIDITHFDPPDVAPTSGVFQGNEANEEIVRGWLQRHKRYPRVAVMRRTEGSVLLYLVLDPAGRVVTSEIRESSGSSLLDDAVLDMVKRADPFPLVPGEMDGKTEYIVPIDFELE